MCGFLSLNEFKDKKRINSKFIAEWCNVYWRIVVGLLSNGFFLLENGEGEKSEF